MNTYLYSGNGKRRNKDNFFKNVIDSLGTNSLREAALNANESVSEREKLLSSLKESVYDTNLRTSLHEAAQQEIDAIEMMIENVNHADQTGMLNEAATDTGAAQINGVTMISFGLQRRAMVSSHLHRSMATITTNKPRVKVAEKKRWIKDINGTKHWFVDAFRPDTANNNITPIMGGLASTADMVISTLPAAGLDIHTEASLSDDEVLSSDITIKSDSTDGLLAGLSIVKADGSTPIAGAARISQGSRRMDPEKGLIYMEIEYGDEVDAWDKTAAITALIDLNTGTVNTITTSNDKVKSITLEVRPSHETHLRALSVGFQIDQKTIEIPDSEHIEAKLVKEVQDDADAYFGLDVLQENTEMLTESITQIRDNKILQFLLDVDKIGEFTFDCTPTGTYARSKEEYMKETFKPFLDKIAIQLKDKTQIKDAHFRIVGNPADIRIAADNEFVYSKSQVYDGSITLDYDFSIVNGVHTMYILSSDRVPKGKMYMQMIPNQLEDNIITTIFAQYKVMVTNNYRSASNASLPATVMSDRVKAFDYFPVVAEIVVTNNEI